MFGEVFLIFVAQFVLSGRLWGESIVVSVSCEVKAFSTPKDVDFLKLVLVFTQQLREVESLSSMKHANKWVHIDGYPEFKSYPLPSMYGIFTYIWLIFMVNVGK